MKDVSALFDESISPVLVDAKTVAMVISVSPRYVHLLAESGQIPACRFGKRCVRFNLPAVLKAIGAEKAMGRNGIT